MDNERELLETIRSLPPERQVEVVDFVAFIKQRTELSLESGARPVGLCQGEFVLPDDFNAPLPDSVIRDFES